MRPSEFNWRGRRVRIATRRTPSPNLRNLVWCFAAALLLVIGCSSQSSDTPLGSETNFLKYCQDESCGAGLVCNCGVCTQACDDDVACEAFGAIAECRSLPVGDQTPSTCSTEAMCEARCITNGDCENLGDDFHCAAGVCRSGAQVCTGLTLPTGDFERSLVIDGVVRSYIVHVPANYSNDSPTPLVLDFHAMGMTTDWQRSMSGYLDVSNQEGFIVVWPQGVDNTWNVGPCCASEVPQDDFQFVTSLVRELSTEACVDQRRIYATGFSFGGAMAYYAACQHAEMFAAVAVSSMDLFVDSEIECHPSRPVTTIAFRGTEDTVIPYDGGEGSPPGQFDIVHEFKGAVGTFETWASLNECAGAPSAPDSNGCTSYNSCEANTEVTLCTVEGGSQIQADAQLAWETLKRHQLP
jgi:polyhydroxybutyrate depolymerase